MIKIDIRKADSDDLPSIIQLLADDLLGAQREDSAMPPNALYLKAWDNISKNNNCEIFVVEDQGKVVGVAQLDYLQYLTYQGGRRAQIEGVRVHREYRNKGIGKKLFQFLIEKARQNDCHLVQLTTDITRPDALKFYESLGFVQSHIGMKLHFEKKTEADNEPKP
ncbi:GNAT family N-acetyltransferase [Legionella nagasakiensis]|uniref:GNAT family N-acetyltransferase n=1 Tax=Legionella nagasakiensis TaxID=535290 RepID=UPI0010559EF6|nr:GNAT family N-acetyltransferase [Legionella nagasakiensis]